MMTQHKSDDVILRHIQLPTSCLVDLLQWRWERDVLLCFKFLVRSLLPVDVMKEAETLTF